MLTISELFLKYGMIRDGNLSNASIGKRFYNRTPLCSISYRIVLLRSSIGTLRVTVYNCHQRSTGAIISVLKVITSCSIITMIELLLRNYLFERLSTIGHAPSHLLHLGRVIKPAGIELVIHRGLTIIVFLELWWSPSPTTNALHYL